MASSIIGLVAGLGIAKGLNSLFLAFGIDISNVGLVLETRTIMVALLVGIGATLVSSLMPAIRATRVPPIAALREGADWTIGGETRAWASSSAGPGHRTRYRTEDLTRLFEPFYRADKARSNAEHVGLGLSLASWIVHAHTGQFEAESQPGVGSLFTVCLPLSSPRGKKAD